MRSERINRAIRLCLDRCYESPDPVNSIAQCLDELRQLGELDRTEAARAHAIALRMLKVIAGEPEDQEVEEEEHA